MNRPNRTRAFLILWLAITGCSLGLGAWYAHQNRLFAEDAVRLQGKVLHQTTTQLTGKGVRGRFYHLEYEYEAEGRTIEGYITVQQSTWSRYPVGQPLPLKYLPGNPDNSRVDDPAEDNVAVMDARIATGIGVTTLLIGGIILIRRKKPFVRPRLN